MRNGSFTLRIQMPRPNFDAMESAKVVLIFPMLDGGLNKRPTAIDAGSAGKEHTEC